MDAAMIVKRVRALCGITRQELAKLAGLSPSTIGRIENGALDPTWGTLSSILEATGFRIAGDTVNSAGDPTAITAARPVLEALLDPAAEQEEVDGAPNEGVKQWRARWMRAGWLPGQVDTEGAVRIAIAAGNAGKIARRNLARRTVATPGGWRELGRGLEQGGIDYAVSGLIAARADRASATTASPVIYVDEPGEAVARLGLEEAPPGRGALLIAPAGDELRRVEREGGIRFVSRAQGVLDAFAGTGREPDKAEGTLRSLLAAAA